MNKLVKKIKLNKEDELKIIRQVSRASHIPPQQPHKNKKAYSRKKKFKEDI
jgi:hypothetical protein